MRLWIFLVVTLCGSSLCGQLSGPDVEVAVGLVGAFQKDPGSGPGGRVTINQGYSLTKRLYARIGLGLEYRQNVYTDAELQTTVDPVSVLRRRIDLSQLDGLARASLGVEAGRWSVEVGATFLQVLRSVAGLTVAEYTPEGTPLTMPTTRRLKYRFVPPEEYLGDYFIIRRLSGWGSVVINTQVSPRIVAGLSYTRTLGNPQMVHTSEFTCPRGVKCTPTDTFRREIPATLGMLSASLRFRLGSR